jgi:hypothetical protein
MMAFSGNVASEKVTAAGSYSSRRRVRRSVLRPKVARR